MRRGASSDVLKVMFDPGCRASSVPRGLLPEFSRRGPGTEQGVVWGGSPVSVEERVIEIVSEQMGVAKDQVTRETSFVNDLGADSLDTVELVMEFEEEFDITIPDEEAEKIQTVGQAIQYIEEHTK